MLLWLWLLAMYSALVVGQNRDRNRELMPFVIATLMTTALLFLAMLALVEDPFRQLPHAPRDGQGLNPLLQNPLMVIHPPNLYLGFVGFVVPFAFGIGALARIIHQPKKTDWGRCFVVQEDSQNSRITRAS